MRRKSGHQQQEQQNGPVLSLVVKGDTIGCEEAVSTLLLTGTVPGVRVEILHKGVGDICKSDVLAAAAASRLVIGFNVGVLPRVAELSKEHDVEIRLYSLIYRLQEDITAIAETLLPRPATEEILGSARVIALFKGSRKGIILGCQVEQGRLQVGDRFRVIAAMGPVYEGAITSLHIERDAVNKAMAGQQVGLKIEDFKTAKIGDRVEAYRRESSASKGKWVPSGRIVHL